MTRGWIALVVAAAALTACAEPPRHAEEVRALFADAAIGVDRRWAPEEIAAAREAFQAAEREMQVQRGRFAWMRDQTRSTVLLDQAEQDLIRARASAARARRSAESRAREAIDGATMALRDARSLLLITQASGGRRGGAGVSRLAEAEARIEEARELVAAGRFDEAEKLLDRIHDSIAALHSPPSGRDAGLY